MGSYVSNHERSVMIDGIEFEIAQRNIGYATNDGRWLVRQKPDMYFDFQRGGQLYYRREGKFVGIADTSEEALELARKAEPTPEIDRPVR